MRSAAVLVRSSLVLVLVSVGARASAQPAPAPAPAPASKPAGGPLSAALRDQYNSVKLNVTEATSGQPVTVYNQDPALRGRQDFLWNNDPEMDSTYNGGDITLNKRLSHGWMMTGGLSLGKDQVLTGIEPDNDDNDSTIVRFPL